MSRAIVVASFASGCVLGLVACGAIADLAGLDRSVKNITIVLPSTILVGDTVQATVVLTAGNGKPAQGDTVVTWRSSDPASISVDAAGRVTSSVVGAHATIYADVGKVTGSLTLSVGDDQRIGYALADQPAAAGPYEPDPNYSFDSSGGTIQVMRSSAGVYSVRFAGLGRQPGQRDNLQVTGNGGPGGIFCKLGGEWQTSGADMLADVRCFTPAGAPADSKFTILLSGARVYVLGSRLGFALMPASFASSTPGNSAVNVDTTGTTRNNSSRTIVSFGHTAVGEFPMAFPGLERISGTPGQGAETYQVTAVGPGPERCYEAAVDPPTAELDIKCSTTGGVPVDTRFSVLLLQRGRAAHRFGYAWANNPTSAVDYNPVNGFWRNNSGLPITARQVSAGVYRIVLGGQAKAAGATETILLTPWPADDICTTSSWGNSGSDLAVNVACFDTAGHPASATFNILMLQ